MKRTVLFLCVHNSARSQMAEAFLRQMAGDRFEVESAGFKPSRLNPLAVEAMRRAGIDIGGARTQDVFELFKAGRRFHYVISVCDQASAERCPVFPGVMQRVNWSFPDPSTFVGTDEQRLEQTVVVRDQIRARVSSWLDDFASGPGRRRDHE